MYLSLAQPNTPEVPKIEPTPVAYQRIQFEANTRIKSVIEIRPSFIDEGRPPQTDEEWEEYFRYLDFFEDTKRRREIREEIEKEWQKSTQ